MSINTPSDGVNIALHNIEGSIIKQVQVNNPGDVYSKTLIQRLNLQPTILKHPMFVRMQAKQLPPVM